VVNYVLGNPSSEDRKAMDDAIQRALEVLPLVMQGHFDRAMNALNRRADSAPGQKAEK
jgi:PTH1 family peptidyl-tRNA hydrolase